MNQEELDIDLIEKHLKGQLSGDEQLLFEKKVKEDEEFAEKIEDYKSIIDTIKINERSNFKNEVAAWEKEIAADEAVGKTFSIKRYWPLAMAAVLIIGFLFYYLPSSQDADDLFFAYYIPYEDVITVRNESGEDHLKAGMSYYNQGNYETAITELKQHVAANTNDVAARFYLGSAQLAVGQAKPAIETFNVLLSEGENMFTEQAEWYLALAYLANNERELCRQELDKILLQPDHFYATSAKKLLEDLS